MASMLSRLPQPTAAAGLLLRPQLSSGLLRAANSPKFEGWLCRAMHDAQLRHRLFHRMSQAAEEASSAAIRRSSGSRTTPVAAAWGAAAARPHVPGRFRGSVLANQSLQRQPQQFSHLTQQRRSFTGLPSPPPFFNIPSWLVNLVLRYLPRLIPLAIPLRTFVSRWVLVVGCRFASLDR